MEPIASGGFGSIWLARQVDLDRLVVVKILHRAILSDRGQVERFLTEARITASLSHPHIVVLIDHGFEAGIPWIVYEYLTGKSLRHLIDAGPVPWPTAFGIASQIASALEAAHANGILHRDIKPENVLEASPGQYKVVDFGIAKWKHGPRNQTADGVVLGTPEYVAPEQLLRRDVSPAADLYSLGILTYELVTGTVPFREANLGTLFRRHLEDAPPPAGDRVPDLPRKAEAIIQRALAKSPDERFASAAELCSALSSAVAQPGGRGGRAARSRDPERTITTAPLRPHSTVLLRPSGPLARWVALGVLTALGLVAILAATLRLPGPRPAAPPGNVSASQASADLPGLTAECERVLEAEDSLFKEAFAIGRAAVYGQDQKYLVDLERFVRQFETFHDTMRRLLHALEIASPGGPSASIDACFLEARIRARLFTTWGERLRTRHGYDWLRSRDKSEQVGPKADVLGLQDWREPEYDRGGIDFLAAYFVAVARALDALLRDERTACRRLAALLADATTVASAFRHGRPTPGTERLYRLKIERFLGSTSRFQSPTGRLAARYLSELWWWLALDRSAAAATRRRNAAFQSLCAVVESCPGAREALAGVVGHHFGQRLPSSAGPGTTGSGPRR
ncbi:MAG: serine/threonine protein kinase [Candidatus Riflebacteria bacterium]|nr:serine/threonine protein kinase [Candidatus Riflebacteria bacterium]